MDALPVTIIGGYLGAGKTTLVNQMLRQADGARIAVLVNEFGELPIDEDLIEARDENLISIAGGCICCSFGNDLMASLQQIADFNPSPDHIVIESSGVALPAAIANSVSLVDGLRVEGICVLVDALNTAKLFHDEYIGDTIERQLSEANFFVVTKTDLVEPETLDRTLGWLARDWPRVPNVTASHGNVPNSVLLGSFAAVRRRPAHPHADNMYDSVSLSFTAACDAALLASKLVDPSLGILRAKGHLNDVSGKRALIQLAGQRSEISYPENPGPCGVILIGLKERLNSAAIDQVISSCLNGRSAAEWLEEV